MRVCQSLVGVFVLRLGSPRRVGYPSSADDVLVGALRAMT